MTACWLVPSATSGSRKVCSPPLDPAKRARNHHGDVSQERALFLPPAEEDPARFIGFRQEFACAKRGNRRAKETINALGLNREHLSEERRDHLSRLVYLRRVLDQEAKLTGTAEGRQLLQEADAYLREASLAPAKFADMVRAAAGLKL